MSASAPPLRRRWRILLTFAVVAPPLGLLALALPRAAHEGTLPELPCWVLPNLQVMPAPGSELCPIRVGQTLARVEGNGPRTLRRVADLRAALEHARAPLRVELREGARVHTALLPLLRSSRSSRLARLGAAAVAVLLLLGTPLFLVWRSSSRAAVPLALFQGCVCAVLVTVVAGTHCAAMTHVALLALVLAPAAAAHLSLVFPIERPLLREVPGLLAAPYAASALLLPIGWVALARDSLLWPAFVSLEFGATAAAWLVLTLSCWFAVRESRSAIERARARIVLYGGVLVPVAPALWLARAPSDPGELAASYLWSAAVAMPLPIALAIGRYNLFDLESDVRHAIARILYLALAAWLVTVLLPAALAATGSAEPIERAPLFLLAAACVIAIEALRSRTLGALEAFVTPRLQHLRRQREAFERALVIQKDRDEIAQLLLDAVRGGVAPRSGCVLLCEGDAWRSARAFGTDALPRESAAREALRLLGAGSLLHLAASPALQQEARVLAASRVEAVVSIESGGTRYGLLLVGSPSGRRPLSGLELEHCAALAARASTALHNARITAELVAAERQAAIGRAALGLAHDVGKDLGWMRLLVRRLPDRVGDPARIGRDAAAIGELTDGLASAIERFVRDATRPCDAGSRQRFDGIVSDVLRRIERLHGAGRVRLEIAPALEAVRLDSMLGRAIGNLLDNALHASAECAPVTLCATHEDAWVQVVVEDQGCGIGEQALMRVLEPGFTTRAGAGGSGVGLPVALEIADALGGALELRSGARGTRATIRTPVPAG